MKRILPLLLSAFTLMVFSGCSSENSNATFGAHPADWMGLHALEANADLDSCRSCHGFNFEGSGSVTSCFDCHASGPPFVIHPATWTDTINDHQTFFTSESWTSCANATCHGTALDGGDFGPSCFAADYDGISCHATGPSSSHGGIGSYRSGSAHGPDAKVAQIECRNCHGRPTNVFDGGFVVDILGQNGASGGNCSTPGCHPEARAHPVNWQGSNDTGGYLSSHRGVFNSACALCHKTDGPGSGPLPPAPSCYATDYQNSASSDALVCHAGGPGLPHITGAEWLLRSEHAIASIADSSYCLGCHNVSSGGIDPTCQSCHTLDSPVTNTTGCDSCHGNPPNTGEHGGDHGVFDCSTCHFGFGTGSLNHYYPDPTGPADTQLNPNDLQITTMTFNKDSSGNVTSCSGSCHGENHNDNW